jgi:hypothetical protein
MHGLLCAIPVRVQVCNLHPNVLMTFWMLKCSGQVFTNILTSVTLCQPVISFFCFGEGIELSEGISSISLAIT